jgi:hypothetical protein
MAIPEVPEILSVQGYSWTTLSPGGVNKETGPPGWGLGVRLTTSSCKEKCVEKFLRGKKFLEEARAHMAVVPLILMMMMMNTEDRQITFTPLYH